MSSNSFSLSEFQKQKIIKSHNDTKNMRIVIESKMKRLASPITQNDQEVKNYLPQRKSQFNNYLKTVKERENANHDKNNRKTTNNSPCSKSEKKISIKTFILNKSKEYIQPSLKVFKDKYDSNTTINSLTNSSEDYKRHMKVTPIYKSPSKEMIEYNDKKGGYLNNSLKTFNDKFIVSNVLVPEKLPCGKIQSIKIIKTYSKNRASVDQLIQYKDINIQADCITQKINSIPFNSPSGQVKQNRLLSHKYNNRHQKYFHENINNSIF